MFPLHLLFLMTLMLGSLIAINASSWLVAWIGLEMNLLSFLPLISSEKLKGSSESCMKYFLVQSMASLLILMSSVFVLSTMMFNSIPVIFIGLAIKLGAAPFHYWFPSVMEGMGWFNCSLLMTWQKLAPLFLMSFMNLIMIIIIITSLVGAVGGFGQFSLSKILAFSSINHVGWMLGGMLWGFKLSLVYFLIYFVITILIVLSFFSFKMFFISQISSFSYSLKLMILMNFLSLGGMPPLLGFFPKWLVIEKLLWESYFITMVLIISSLISLYFYIRVIYPPLLVQFLGSEGTLGGTFYTIFIIAFFFLSSGGVFCYPLLSSI